MAATMVPMEGGREQHLPPVPSGRELLWTGLHAAPCAEGRADGFPCIGQVLNMLLNMESAHRAALQQSTQHPRSVGAWVKWQQQVFFKGLGRRLLGMQPS